MVPSKADSLRRGITLWLLLPSLDQSRHKVHRSAPEQIFGYWLVGGQGCNRIHTTPIMEHLSVNRYQRTVVNVVYGKMLCFDSYAETRPRVRNFRARVTPSDICYFLPICITDVGFLKQSESVWGNYQCGIFQAVMPPTKRQNQHQFNKANNVAAIARATIISCSEKNQIAAVASDTSARTKSLLLRYQDKPGGRVLR